MIERLDLPYTSTRNNGLYVLNEDAIRAAVPDLPISDRSVVAIPPNAFGGNHKHPRTEVFVAVSGEPQLLWQDEQGKTHLEEMTTPGGLVCFVIRSMTPHAVINRGHDLAVMYELADAKQQDVEAVDVLAGFNPPVSEVQ